MAQISHLTGKDVAEAVGLIWTGRISDEARALYEQMAQGLNVTYLSPLQGRIEELEQQNAQLQEKLTTKE